MNMKKKSRNIATSGILTALATVCLLLGSVFQTLDLSVAAIGGFIVLVAMIEMGPKWALGVYFTTAIITMVILPYKTAALIFACFTGFYPVLKKPLNDIKNIVLSYIARIAVFNLFMTLAIYVGLNFLNIEEDFFVFGIIVYILANITFIVYDYAMERFVFLYNSRLRGLFFSRR